MVLVPGQTEDAREIAIIYQAAFSDSIRRFFPKKNPQTVLCLLEQTFRLVFFIGGQAVLVNDHNDRPIAYCFYSYNQNRSGNKDFPNILRAVLGIIKNIGPIEAFRLLYNKCLMSLTVQRKPHFRTASAEIISLAVHPDYQSLGLGSRLLCEVLRLLPKTDITLNVRTTNRAGRRLYSKAGFRIQGSTKDISGHWLMLIRSAPTNSVDC